ncbi:MAG: hypothetical protein LLG44_09185 [Chloroflexi bacterium]|nr:hypothetical protein [Chloroflexota bacterium]
MIDRNPNPLQPQYGSANQAQTEQALDQLNLDTALLARRGRLYLLCGLSTDALLPTRLYETYYSSKKLDPMRNLYQAVGAAQELDEAATIMGALVHNMTLYIAGTSQARGWIWRNQRLITVLPDPRGEVLGVPNKAEATTSDTPRCLSSERRLYPGDCIILADSNAEHKMSARLLHKAALFAPDSNGFAESLAQALRTTQHPYPLVTVIQLPGTATTPQLPPQSELEYAHASSMNLTSRAGVSPVLITAILALLAILLAIAVNRPRIPTDVIKGILMGNQAATETAEAAGTATPGIEATEQPTSESAD